jgi:hypothetical protein
MIYIDLFRKFAKAVAPRQFVFCMLLLVSVSLFAGFAYGQSCPAPTTKTITIDGNPSDWSNVVNNCSQTTIDGTGYNVACPSADRDCGNINQAGRDLVRFSWTYDSSYVYLFLERSQNTNNQMNYLFYMDSNQSTYMENNEKILEVLTQNTSASIAANHGHLIYFTYTRAGAAANDPLDKLVDSNGFADGFTIKGTINQLDVPDPPALQPTAALFTQSFSDGTAVSGFEARVPWTMITPINPSYGTYPFPIDFHISSVSGENVPSSVQDNMGGPGGTLGSFGFAAVTVTPNNTGSALPNSIKTYNHTITNTGIFADSYTYSATSSLGYSLSVSPASPTSQLSTSGTASISVQETIPANAVIGAVDVITVTATSVLNPTVFATATDTTTVGNLVVTPASQSKTSCLASLGASCNVTYTETITNNVNSDSIDLKGVSANGWKVEYFDGATPIAVDANGNGVFTDAGDSIFAGYNLNGNALPDLTVTGGSSRSFTIRISPLGGTPGTTIDTLTLTALSDANDAQATATDLTSLRAPLEITPSYLLSAGTNLYGGAGNPVYFPNVIQNNTNASVSFSSATLTAASNSSPSNQTTWAKKFWTDPNGDGSNADGSQITGATTISVGANGGQQAIVYEIDVPSATAETSCTSALTATSGSFAGATTDELKVTKIAPFVNSNFTVQGTNFTNCTTMYAKGFQLNPGTQYWIHFQKPGGTDAQKHQLVADTNGDIFDSYTVLSADLAGTWNLQLRDGADSAILSPIPFQIFVERNGSVTSVTTGQVSYPLSGTPVSFSANFQNTNSVADYPAVTLEFSIQNSAGNQYMDGTTGNFSSGTSDTKTISAGALASGATVSGSGSVATPNFTSLGRGVYTLHARWKLDCGSSIPPDTTYNFLVGPTIDSFDSSLSTGKENFLINGPETVYFKGDIYESTGTYKYGVFDPSNNLISSGTTNAAAGVITPTFSTAGHCSAGTWHIGIYPNSSTVPGVFATTDIGRYSSDSFTLSYVAPTISSPTNGSITNNNKPPITGTATANSTVTIYIDSTSVGTTTADGSGNYSFTPTNALGEGSHSVYTTSTVSGCESTASSTKTFTVDTIAPSAPPVTSITNDTGSSGTDGITSDQNLIISGTGAESNSNIAVYKGGTQVGTTTANGAGAWSFDYTGTTLTSGSYSFTATATDAAGNTSGQGTAFDVTIDTTAPSAPSVTPVTVNTHTPTIQGTWSNASGETLTVLLNGHTYTVGDGNLTVNGTDWTLVVPAGDALPDGTYSVTATVTDTAGNSTSDATASELKIDTVPPNAPVITSISDDTGILATDGITSDRTLIIHGTAEANSMLTVYVDTGSGPVSIGTTAADGSGNWTFDYTGTQLNAGNYTFTATATDSATNTSSASSGFPVLIDFAAPNAPVVTAIAEDTAGASATDGITSDQTLDFSGTAEPNSRVEVFLNGVSIGTTTADNGGAWTLDHTGSTIAEGTYPVTAVATDAAGNASGPSSVFTLTVDKTAPSAPPVSSISADTGSSGTDGITSDQTLTISGIGAEANSTITVYKGGVSIGPTTADGSGAWTFDYTGTMLTDGTYSFTATATDASGNTSSQGTAFNVTIDTTHPVAPTVTPLTISSHTPTIQGTWSGAAGETLTVTLNGITYVAGDGNLTGNGNGTWTLVVPGGDSLPDGTYNVIATVTDTAGNATSDGSGGELVVDTTAPNTPVISSPADGSSTNNHTPTLTGTAEAGSTVSVYIDGSFVGTATADGSGNWSYLCGCGTLTDISHTVHVTAADALGNTSGATSDNNFTVFTIGLLRYGGITQLNPQVPANSAIFPLTVSRDVEYPNYPSQQSFTHDELDLGATPPLVYYQVVGNSQANSLLVTKSGGKVVVSYTP